MKKLFTIIFILGLISGYSQTDNHSTGPAPFATNEFVTTNLHMQRYDLLPAYGSYLNIDDNDVLVNFHPDTVSVMDSLLSLSAGAGSFVSAMEQVIDNDDQFYYIEHGSPELYIANITTGTTDLVGQIVPDQPSLFNDRVDGMAYDITTNKYYIITSNRALWLLDPLALTATYVNQLDIGMAIALAFDISGNLYTYDIGNDSLYMIDELTGGLTAIGDIGFNANYAQGMDYYPEHKTMYMAAFNNDSGKGEWRSVNLTTGNTTFLGYLGDTTSSVNELGSLVFIKKDTTIIVHPPFSLTATVNNDDVLLTWSVTETVKDIEYDGFNVYRDGEQINDTMVPDTTYLDLDLDPGLYTYGVTTVLNGMESDPVFVDAEVLAPIPPPLNLEATVNSNDIQLNWTIYELNKNTEYDGFNVYRDDVQINDTLVPDTTYHDLNLLPDIYTYSVTTVRNDMESAAAFVEAEIEPYHMGGTIFINGVPVDEATAYSYQMEGNEIIDVISYFTDTLGYYSFYPIAMTNYLIKAVPNSSSEFADDYLPTYYGDVLTWTDATLKVLNDNIYDADINLIPASLNNEGDAEISGYIHYDEEGSNLWPAADIQIVAGKVLSGEYGMTVSEDDGYFSFSDLNDGTYEIHAEIVGKESEKAVIEVNNATQQEYEVNLIILDDAVVLSIDDDLPAIYNHVSKIYPNPAKNQARIALQSIKPVDLNVRVYNTTGQLLIQDDYENVQNQILHLDISQIPVGQYQVVISDGFGNLISRKLLKF